MTRQIISTTEAPAAIGPYSQAIMAGDPKTMLIVAGGIKEQTHQVLKNLQAIIIAAGMQLKNIVKCSCFLKNMNDFVEFNGVYTEYLCKTLPARECVEVARLPKDVLVEISAICVKHV